LVPHRPARSWIHSISAKQHVHSRDDALALAVPPAPTPPDPHTRWPLLPHLAIAILALAWIQPSNLHIHDDLVLGAQLLLPLPLNIHIALGDPAGLEQEVLLDAVPDGGVELAAAEGARLDGDVGHEEARVVRGQVGVDGRWENTVAGVEEVDEDDEEEGEEAELGRGANLYTVSTALHVEGTCVEETYYSSRHGLVSKKMFLWMVSHPHECASRRQCSYRDLLVILGTRQAIVMIKLPVCVCTGAQLRLRRVRYRSR
jgi:hypothetical protein